MTKKGKPQRETSRFEALPNDLLSEIMTKVGSHSREDLKHCMLTCKELNWAVDNPKVYKNLNLAPLLTNPLEGENHYHNLLQKGVQHSNPTAQYVQGILDYFVNDKYAEGLNNLKEAANASFQEAIYLYGIINLCLGDYDEGNYYMDKLNWRKNTEHAEQCWIKIMATMQNIWIEPKNIYMQSLSTMEPPYSCNRNDMDNTCYKCFYYKTMVKFIFKF